MCVITICRNKREKNENLRAMEESNDHGIGVVYYKGGIPQFKKNITIDEVIKLNKTLEFPYAFHFRISTVGHSKMLTHPFVVSKESELSTEGAADMLLMHNGHWTDWNESVLSLAISKGIDIPKGEWSDSRAMAFIAGNTGTNILKMMSGQKIAVFQRDKKILVFGTGWEMKDKDLIYSNTHWEWRTRTSKTPTLYDWQTRKYESRGYQNYDRHDYGRDPGATEPETMATQEDKEFEDYLVKQSIKDQAKLKELQVGK